MNIGFYSPYLDTLGGGERYVLTLASYWSMRHEVELFWDDISIEKEAKQRLNIDLSRVKIVQNIFRRINVFKKLLLTRKYDVLFILSDGSIPWVWSRSAILHFQCPFPFVKGRSLVNQAKLTKYGAVVCNSKFTKRFIDEEFQAKAHVIYPPVYVDVHTSVPKEKIILSVGRFSTHFINKKQVEIVSFFRKFHKNHKAWSLVLAGGLLEQDRSYFDRVLREARDLPVEILPNVSYNRLVSLYEKASIYWHAAGYGEDPERNPASMEHFGITTVEAMSAGAVPIVYAGGGQQEIIQDGTNGYLWYTVDELIERTTEMVRDTGKREAMRIQAQKRALAFDESRFTKSFDDLLMNIV